MDKQEVLAKIYNLAGNILSGKADKEEIGEVVKLAIDNGCQKELQAEFLKIHDSLLK